jgi:hypothetical protein
MNGSMHNESYSVIEIPFHDNTKMWRVESMLEAVKKQLPIRMLCSPNSFFQIDDSTNVARISSSSDYILNYVFRKSWSPTHYLQRDARGVTCLRQHELILWRTVPARVHREQQLRQDTRKVSSWSTISYSPYELYALSFTKRFKCHGTVSKNYIPCYRNRWKSSIL